MVEKGNHYFVRQTFTDPLTNEPVSPGNTFLITNYKEKEQADAHLHAIQNDQYRYLYDWQNPTDRQKLLKAASQPPGYKIYAPVLKAGMQYKLNAEVQKKIRRHVERTLRWARGGQTIQSHTFLQYGQLHVKLTWGLKEVSLKLSEIETV